MLKLIFFLLTVTALDVQAQLFADKEFYPGVRLIKMKSYSGTGGKGWLTLKILDSQGRISVEESYKKGELLSRTIYRYNSNDDIVMEIPVFDINNIGRTDTIITYYKYNNSNQIIYQGIFFKGKISDVIELVENMNDTVHHYRRTSNYYRHDLDSIIVNIEYYTVTYNSEGNLIQLINTPTKSNQVLTTYYSYYPNGLMKNRRVVRIPPDLHKAVYAGGPGSDDMSYKYKMDASGRVKRKYVIIEDRSYKVAGYRYIAD